MLLENGGDHPSSWSYIKHKTCNAYKYAKMKETSPPFPGTEWEYPQLFLLIAALLPLDLYTLPRRHNSSSPRWYFTTWWRKLSPRSFLFLPQRCCRLLLFFGYIRNAPHPITSNGCGPPRRKSSRFDIIGTKTAEIEKELRVISHGRFSYTKFKKKKRCSF